MLVVVSGTVVGAVDLDVVEVLLVVEVGVDVEVLDDVAVEVDDDVVVVVLSSHAAAGGSSLHQ